MKMKKIYIQPETDIIVVDTIYAILFDSDNEKHTGTRQEGDGENSPYVPGNGGILNPEDGERNANRHSLWDE